MSKYYLVTIVALCALGVLFFSSTEPESSIVVRDDVAPTSTEVVEVPTLVPPSQSVERSNLEASFPGSVEEPKDVAADSSENAEDRSDWTVYQWRDVHAKSWLERFSTATALDERVIALKAVEGIAIANILDSRGLGRTDPEFSPANKGDSWGYSLNGVTYEFKDQDFPEYQTIVDLQSRLFTKPEPGEVREISDDLEQRVLDRLEESLVAVANLGRGPSYHNR